MNNLTTTRRLTHSLLLLAALGASQIQATKTLQVTENGSGRALQRSHQLQQDSDLELAENGSERALERSRRV